MLRYHMNSLRTPQSPFENLNWTIAPRQDPNCDPKSSEKKYRGQLRAEGCKVTIGGGVHTAFYRPNQQLVRHWRFSSPEIALALGGKLLKAIARVANTRGESWTCVVDNAHELRLIVMGLDSPETEQLNEIKAQLQNAY